MIEIIIDIITVALISFCIITQLEWLKLSLNGSRKTEQLFLISSITLFSLAAANLSKDIFLYDTVFVQRVIFMTWSGIAVYFYQGKTFK